MKTRTEVVCCIGIYLCAWFAPSHAQTGDWRIEMLGAPPLVQGLYVYDSIYVAATTNELYTFDPEARRWNGIGRFDGGRGDFRFSVQQPDGKVLIVTSTSVFTFDVRTATIGEVVSWPSTNKLVALVVEEETGDTIVGETWTEVVQPNGLRSVHARWTKIATGDVIWQDTAFIYVSHPPSKAIVLSDTSMFIAIEDSAYTFPYPRDGKGRMRRAQRLPDSIFNAGVSVWLDRGSQPNAESHVLLSGKNGWMYSSDVASTQGTTWTSVFPTGTGIRRPRQLMPTMNADELMVLIDSALYRYTISTEQADTVLRADEYISDLPFADGPLGTMVSTLGATMLIDVQHDRDTVNVGLPERSANYLFATTDGVLASTTEGKIYKNGGGSWSQLPIDYDDMYSGNGWNTELVIRGARSTSDFWFTTRNMMYCVQNNAAALRQVMPMPRSSVWVPEDASYMTCLVPKSGSVDVAWWRDTSLRTLFNYPMIRYLVSFSDSIHVAIARSGHMYRPDPGTIDMWSLVDSIHFSSPTGLEDIRHTTNGSYAVLNIDVTEPRGGRRDIAVTHDAGATWSTHTLDLPPGLYVGDATISKNGVLFLATRNDYQSDDDDLIVYRKYLNAPWTEIGRFPLDSLSISVGFPWYLAYDDTESRLYVSSTYWMVSVGIDPIIESVDESQTHARSAPSNHHGIYDMMGRFVCTTIEQIQHTGLYVVVTEHGTSLRMISR